MDKPTFDPGLTQQYTGALKRVVNQDGKFNARRTGGTWRDTNPYLFLISISWPAFIGLVAVAYVVLNLIFAGLYTAVGMENIKGTEAPTTALRFLNIVFFSAHTLSTVGYGNMWPSGAPANSIAALEALIGLMVFAIATGLLFGRFSRPSARVGFSKRALVAPYIDAVSLQCRVVNRRSNNLINLEARVLLMTVELVDNRPQRRFTPLELERSQVWFLALTWTIVHPIDEKSPLYGKTAADLERLQAEFMILLSGFDDTFSQTVHTRYSYRYDEIVWGAKFAPAFEIDKEGELVIEVDRVSAIQPAPSAEALEKARLT
ncbi:MAG TPA: ion channel [Bryobacteraceae bacterium]|jgi:inward rectifier potassium channel|nr:ion channel [Bryobacteraceae bacterium]